MVMLLQSNALRIPLSDGSVHCCVTSPPYYGLRDYGNDDQLGLEPTPEDYVANMVAVFREVWRVLRDDGTLWLNLGDSYAGGGRGGNPDDSPFRKQATNRGSLVSPQPVPPGCKPKDLIGIPWLVAFALQRDGWYLRSDIVWNKPSCMPESVKDRPTKAHEYVFLLAKQARYYYDADAIKEDADPAHASRYLSSFHTGKKEADNGRPNKASNTAGMRTFTGYRNRRTVWTVPTQPYTGAHFATFPPALIEPMIKAGCPADGIVLDPFVGSGTTVQVARNLGRRAVGLDISAEYLALAQERTNTDFGRTYVKSESETLYDLPLFNELMGENNGQEIR